MRKRIGPKEQVTLNAIIKKARNFKIFKQHKNKTETYFNNLLINVIRQGTDIENKNIHSAKFVGETFRPECYIKGAGSIPLCAFECKKLSEKAAKSRWKDGISQAILYSHFYKSVVLMFYDYTKDGRYAVAFSNKRSIESQFSESLREAFRIHIVVIKPEK